MIPRVVQRAQPDHRPIKELRCHVDPKAGTGAALMIDPLCQMSSYELPPSRDDSITDDSSFDASTGTDAFQITSHADCADLSSLTSRPPSAATDRHGEASWQ